MKKFIEPSVELLSFQPQEATMSEFNELGTEFGFASLANWWEDDTE